MIILDQRYVSSLTKIGGGGSVLVGFSAPKPKRRFRQPWKTRPFWNSEARRWEVTILEGFVNGMDPSAHGYLSSDDIPYMRDIDLIEQPIIPVNGYRVVPGSGDPLPPFFKQFRIMDYEKGLIINPQGGVTMDLTPEAGPSRTLVAVDFYIAVARATYQSSITEVDATGVTSLVVDYSVTFDTTNLDNQGARPRLMQASKFPAVNPPNFFDRLAGTFQDEGEDRILISTLFLLSPPGVQGEPDFLWTPYVKHSQCWNLGHAARNDKPAKPIQPIRLFTGLALGLGDAIANQALSGVNELAQIVNNAANTTSNEGKFWNV